MKKIAAIISVLLLSFNIYSNEIDWLDDWNEALEMSEETEKNIVLLITAPTWCSWCIKLENQVLKEDRIIDYINENFVPLRILDTDDEVSRFRFSGFPSFWILNRSGEKIADIYSLDQYSVRSGLEQHNGINRAGETIYIEIDEELLVEGWSWLSFAKSILDNESEKIDENDYRASVIYYSSNYSIDQFERLMVETLDGFSSADLNNLSTEEVYTFFTAVVGWYYATVRFEEFDFNAAYRYYEYNMNADELRTELPSFFEVGGEFYSGYVSQIISSFR